MGGGLESRCVGRVYDADSAVRRTVRRPVQNLWTALRCKSFAVLCYVA